MLTPDAFAGPRAFARYMLRDERLQIRPVQALQSMKTGMGATEVVLFREACWQVTLLVLEPNLLVPSHKHHRVDSVDLAIAGDGFANIGSTVRARAVSAAAGLALMSQLQRVPKGVAHGGSAGPVGGCFLSFQRWDGEPDSVMNDWEWCDA